MADNPGLDSIIQGQITQALQAPEDFPQEFLDWLPQYLSIFPPSLTNASIQGGTFTPVDQAAHNIAFGTGTLNFAASQTASDVQPHGLGSIPVFVGATCASGYFVLLSGSGDASDVTIEGWWSTAITGTVPYFWFAIS